MISPTLERKLRQQFDGLIGKAETLLQDSPIHKAKSKPETTALANLIAVAQSATCFKEIELFVQYQAARDSRKWQEGHRFATNLGSRLEEVRKLAARIADDDDSRREAEVWLAIQFLGFVRRKYQYLDKFEGGGRR